jgi:opine dehydrogenase
MDKKTIAIIGAGNGGQAMAGHFSMLGHNVRIFNRTFDKIKHIYQKGEITLTDRLNGRYRIDVVTSDIEKVIEGAEIIMVTTTANAHREIANLIAPFVSDQQIIVLNPGRTLGALEFKLTIQKQTTKKVIIAEAQSLIYACRSISPGVVRVIGIKEKVLISALPNKDTDYVINTLNSIYPCFIKAKNVLHTSLENIGAILHPSIILFNIAAIERKESFYFYQDLTPAVAHFIQIIDNERISIGKAYNIDLLSAFNWVSYAYKNIQGKDLLERIKNNPAYDQILAPDSIHNRMLTEDIPTGVLPLVELAKLASIEVPLLTSVLNITSNIIGSEYIQNGRSFSNLGLESITLNDLKYLIK